MKTIEIGSFEARNRLSDLLRQVERGGRVCITRRGRRMAVLSGIEEDGPSAGDHAARFADFRTRARRGPESLKSLIEEGR